MSGLDRMAQRRDVNGNKLLYDRDRVPDGLDPDVWHLTLLFEDLAEENGHSLNAGRPVAYMEFNNRINSSDIRKRSPHWPGIIEEMMVFFWNYVADPNDSYYAVSEFCKVDVFSNLVDTIMELRERERLVDNAQRRVQPDRDKKPSKRSERDTEALKIIDREYTEKELEDKLGEYRTRTNI